MSVTINGTSGLVFADGSTQASAGYVPFRNKIINGDMRIDQRFAGAAVGTSISGYTVDRWAVYQSTTGKLNGGQNYGSVALPAGFTKYLGVQSQSAYTVAAGDYYAITQTIEGLNIGDLAWGTASASPVTLSFRVYASQTGTFGAALKNGAQNRSYPFTYTVSSANTWTSISVTIPGDTSGTWATDNTAGIYVNFGLGVGSTYSGTAGAWASANYVSATGAVSVVGTNLAAFLITGVQLEKGSTATPFEVRPYGTELALCQRYYQDFFLFNSRSVMGMSDQVKNLYIPNTPFCGGIMRAAPTATTSMTTATTMTPGGGYPGAVTLVSIPTNDREFSMNFSYTYAVVSNMMALTDVPSPDSRIRFNAEL